MRLEKNRENANMTYDSRKYSSQSTFCNRLMHFFKCAGGILKDYAHTLNISFTSERNSIREVSRRGLRVDPNCSLTSAVLFIRLVCPEGEGEVT